MSSPADALLLSLFQSQLLDAQQTAAIRGWAVERSADPAAALRELTARGWLTAFQVQTIAGGKPRDLVVGKFVLVDLLGEGGMGRVYKARDSRLGRDVALKVIRKDKLSNPKVIERFIQEVHAAAALNHPNVVMSFDAETADDTYFLTMEYVEGTDLTKLVRRHGPMPLPHACDAVRQAALGLQHAFEQGLVHRDIKPSNLLYTPRGQVKVLDLGLALLHQAAVPGGENAHRVTQEGFVLGTPDFLAPEQAQNPTGVDIRADVYALGATLFYLCAGRVPFDAPTPTEKMLKHITEPPPDLLAVRPDAPPQLAAIVRWLMAKRPEDRPQTPAQVAAALAPFGLTQSASMPVPHVPPRAMPVNGPSEPDPAPSGAVAFADIEAGEPPWSAWSPDDRPRRRGEMRVKEPKPRSSLPLLIIGLGVVLTVCGGVCLGGGLLLVQLAESGKPLEAEYTTAVGNIKLVRVDGGTFDMGAAEGEAGFQPDEGPVRAVTISKGFYVGETEVTRQQYFDVSGQWPRLSPGQVSATILPRMPATVSWEEANAFLKKLSGREKGPRGGYEFRLPTEAEWEYAARSGGKPAPFGDRAVLQQYTHGIFKLTADDTYGESNPAVTGPYTFDDKPCSIGAAGGDADYQYRREANSLGLFDMAGNVWELCHDRYDNYPPGPVTDPTGPTAGTRRVARGGAFNTTAERCRAAARVAVDPKKPDPSVGFRVVYGPRLSDK